MNLAELRTRDRLRTQCSSRRLPALYVEIAARPLCLRPIPQFGWQAQCVLRAGHLASCRPVTIPSFYCPTCGWAPGMHPLCSDCRTLWHAAMRNGPFSAEADMLLSGMPPLPSELGIKL
jgi:hypothetical protein